MAGLVKKAWADRPVVLSGPSGAGKSSLLKMLFAKYPGRFGFSVSHTTRQPRQGESDGKEYHFVEVPKFKELIEQNQFLEWAIYSGNYYGTSLQALKTLQDSGKIPILDIDLEGVKSVHALNDQVQARFLFIRPPDLETLEQRLRGRGTETESSIAARLASSKKELEHAELYPATHDHVIVNLDLDHAFTQLETFLFTEPKIGCQ